MADADDSPLPTGRYRQFRAPQDDNRALIDPPVATLLSLAGENARRVLQSSCELHGRKLSQLASVTRQRLLDLATHYSQAFCQPAPTATGPLILSGHQPELFHPGVWFKNHVLDTLAKRAGGTGIHLLIDSDLCRTTRLRVPTGTVASPRWETVAYDQSQSERPHEERQVHDTELFSSSANRVVAKLGGLVEKPLIASMWTDAVEARHRGANLGESLSHARRVVEGRWGSQTLELPFSRLCDSPEFRWCLVSLLADLPRVQQAYNTALADYRAAHRLRSPAQPLPDLASDKDWLEAPLWVWSTDDPTRRALSCRRTNGELLLSNRAGGEWRLPIASNDSILDAVDRMGALRDQGIKIRPRALITTLFARLLLGDLFLHGIGGAKYDQVTDEFARRWLGEPPPPHATVTATLQLPIEHPPVSHAQQTDLRVQLRELEFHPEKFPEAQTAAAERLRRQKQSAISAPSLSPSEKHRQIVTANRALQAFVEPRRQAALADLAAVRSQLQASTVLDSREYSFCLFPAEDLRSRYATLLEN